MLRTSTKKPHKKFKFASPLARLSRIGVNLRVFNRLNFTLKYNIAEVATFA